MFAYSSGKIECKWGFYVNFGSHHKCRGSSISVDIMSFLTNIKKMKYPISVLLIIALFLNCASLRPKAPTDADYGRSAEEAAILFERGNDYFKRKDYGNALISFEEIVNDYKATEPFEHALYLAAFCQYKLARFKKAASYGEKHIKEFPNSKYYLNAMSLIGESYFNMAQDYKAAYYLTKYYTQSQDSAGVQQAFERILDMLPELSIAELEKLHRTFMAEAIDEHFLYHLARLEAQKGKEEEAERDFNLLVRRYPNTRYLYEAEEYKRFISLGEATGRAGVLLPLTGKFSNIGQSLLKIVRTFERNRLLPFSLHVIDTKSDPIEATLAAARLIEEMSVDFLIAPISSSEAFGVCGYAFGKTIPTILPMTTEARFESIPMVFTRGQTGEEQARVIAQYSAYDNGINRFAILLADDDHHRNIAEAFAQEVVRNNREVVAMVTFQADSITLKEELEAIKDRDPEALFLAMNTDMIINVAPQVAYYGLDTVALLGTESFHSERVPRLGEKYVEGSMFATPSAINEVIMKQLEDEGLTVSDFNARFYSALWQLRSIRNYERANLARLIEQSLRDIEIFSIYQVKDGEFVKLADISKS